MTALGGYNANVTDYEFHMRLLNKAESTVGLDARTSGAAVPVVENRTRANQSSIGDPDSRYGAWSRKLKVGVPAKIALAEGLQLRGRGGGGVVNASVVYLDASAASSHAICRCLSCGVWSHCDRLLVICDCRAQPSSCAVGLTVKPLRS